MQEAKQEAWEHDAPARQAAEEEAARKVAEEEAATIAAAEEAARKAAAEEAAARKAAEKEAATIAAEEEAANDTPSEVEHSADRVMDRESPFTSRQCEILQSEMLASSSDSDNEEIEGGNPTVLVVPKDPISTLNHKGPKIKYGVQWEVCIAIIAWCKICTESK